MQRPARAPAPVALTPAVRVAVAIAILSVSVIVAWSVLPPPVPRTAGPIDQQAYLWQRRWTPPVREAVEGMDPLLGTLLVLGGEITWRGDVAERAEIRPSWESLECPAEIGVALRVGVFRGDFARTADLVAGDLSAVVAAARAGGVEPVEAQLDFDCPESELDDYLTWVRAARRAVAGVPLTITALPSWLDCGAFADLARETDGFVLQVHSFARPAGPGEEAPLCDVERTLDWIEDAARIGVPFRVALPTYGYLLAYDAHGDLAALSTDQAPAAAGGPIRAVRADPVGLAGLVRRLTEDRPATLEALLWYRLPVEGEPLNWSARTLSRVIRGTPPLPAVRAVIRGEEPGLLEVMLENRGDADGQSWQDVEVRWDGGPLLAADGLSGFETAETGAGRLVFRGSGALALERLPPGGARVVGWLRVGGETGGARATILR